MAAPMPLQNGVSTSGGVGLATEFNQHTMLRLLERGCVFTKFYPKKRPEKRTFQVKLETRQLIWIRNQGGRAEGTVDFREIKEVRPGTNSRDFEKLMPEDARKLDPLLCFVVLYGSQFRLKTLSVAAVSPEEYNLWMTGLKFLVENTQSAPYPLQVERWLWKEFNMMDTRAGVSSQKDREITVTLKDIKSWLPRINLKIPNNKLREKYQRIDTNCKDIGFVAFSLLYRDLVYVPTVFDRYFGGYMSNGENITAEDFLNFLKSEEKDTSVDTVRTVEQLMLQFLDDQMRAVRPFFTPQEFMDWMFSEENTIWNKAFDAVTQDMDQPLSYYWIASSHNTYLTENQYSSESSTEAYARVLQMGCRCIELDCWDGPDNLPHIYHGHTLTSKIRFMDVLYTIKANAFLVSEYPIILSIENHCSLLQQRNMASAFREVFGDMLLIEPIDVNETVLPSPNQLKRRIILKHKKLPDGVDGTDWRMAGLADDMSVADGDLSNSIKNDILFLEDPIDKEWHPHFFVLTQSKLHYTDETAVTSQEDEEEESNDTSLQLEGLGNDEMHFSEKWFHGKLEGGRRKAEDLLKEYSYLGDGTFLVRESDTFVGDFSLSFWRKDSVNHCRIRSKQERGQTKYYLIDNLAFDSLYSLITHYQKYPLRSQDFQQILKEPVPQPQSHHGKPWYHEKLDRTRAEDMLKRIPSDGAFLVRQNGVDTNSYAISFRAEGKIKHCIIKQEGRLFTIGNAQFESLVELVNYYEKKPLYRKMKLKHPVNEKFVQSVGEDPDDTAIYGGPGIYMNPNDFTPKIHVRALYDYRAQMEDELSFCKNAIITNVIKRDEGWWLGDPGNQKRLYFPSNYVEEIRSQDDVSDSMPLGNMQKGTINVTGCAVDRILNGKGDKAYVFRIQHTANERPLEIAAETEEKMLDWMKNIRACANLAEEKVKKKHMIEKNKGIAKEFSDLIVYCRSVPFEPEKAPGNYYDMSSFPETKGEKSLNRKDAAILMKYNKYQLSRVYPKGSRIDSSNYDPQPFWNCGCHMLALNYQTPDRSMQLNEGKFKLNGRCGYILQPECMHMDNFNPFNKRDLEGVVEPLSLSINIIAGRHLVKTGRGIASPFVEVEIVGAEYDFQKYKTSTVQDNGLNPVWNEQCDFDIINPEVALLRFVVQDMDMFNDPHFMGQAVFPVKCLRSGFRSVPLKNGNSEDLELTSLLVHVEMRNPEEEESDIYSSILELRDRSAELQKQIEVRERSEDQVGVERMWQELNGTERRILEKNMQRRNRVRPNQMTNGSAKKFTTEKTAGNFILDYYLYNAVLKTQGHTRHQHQSINYNPIFGKNL
uniref:1-phosphatidylinositol 4,5-bisphosphate phosphodiesterase gamma n=1 Tax=Chaetopterus variopedatus TaxID=34590 RepID=A2IB48_CHAVR|nr:phospholipase C gamma [Chaetopterus pergamentaceus]